MKFKLKKKLEEAGPGVPAYIVTFSDMVTLLLTFFVLLLTLAEEQDPALFDIGKDSFNKSIQGMGLGMFPGRPMSTDFGEIQIKYRTEKAEEDADPRTIDASEERLKRMLNNVKESVAVIPSQIVASEITYSVADVRFSDSSSDIDVNGQKYLRDYTKSLQLNPNNSKRMLYVLGLSNSEKNDRENLALSARRARNVADYIKDNLQSPDLWNIFSWGAGSGGDWVNDPDSPISDSSQIYIAVLNE